MSISTAFYRVACYADYYHKVLPFLVDNSSDYVACNDVRWQVKGIQAIVFHDFHVAYAFFDKFTNGNYENSDWLNYITDAFSTPDHPDRDLIEIIGDKNFYTTYDLLGL